MKNNDVVIYITDEDIKKIKQEGELKGNGITVKLEKYNKYKNLEQSINIMRNL